MTTYTPDRWVVLKIQSKGETVYKVLAGWSGSYTYGSSWKLNSGITKVVDKGDSLEFHGYSGSVYECRKNSYGLLVITAAILQSFQDQVKDKADTSIEVLPEDANFVELSC